MAILDVQNRYSNAQAVTVTAASTDVVDLGPRSRGTSLGTKDLDILFNVNATFTAAGAATLTIQLRSSQASNMASPVIMAQSDALPVAELVAGAKLRFQPTMPVNAGRYTDVNYVVSTGPFTAGSISAYLHNGRQINE